MWVSDDPGHLFAACTESVDREYPVSFSRVLQIQVGSRPGEQKSTPGGMGCSLATSFSHAYTSIPQVVLLFSLAFDSVGDLTSPSGGKGSHSSLYYVGLTHAFFSLAIKNSGKHRHHRRHGVTETSDLESDKVSFSHLTTSQTIFRS